MSSEKNNSEQQESGITTDKSSKNGSPWYYLFRGMWRTPWGLLGLVITTASFTLMFIGLVGILLELIDNPYVGIFIYMILPSTGAIGTVIIFLAAYLRRREWHKFGVEKTALAIDLSSPKHRMWVVRFIVLSVITFITLGVIGYEGYHFTDSAYFCGMVCHKVMEPEYTVYKRSSHAKVSCVECHIGSGASWFVKAKLSGLRQVVSSFTDTYSRPIPAPVEHLRPARDTCEECHWPEKFVGKKVKIFTHFTNEDQVNEEVNEIALHVGGHNPETGKFEGIHWHVSDDVKVKYLAVDKKRTKIAKVKVTRADGSEDEYVKSDIEVPEGAEEHWRVMDCIDCHNRPTHTFDMPEERVDFGLRSKKLNPEIAGIREDSLTILNKSYTSREDAKKMMVRDLLDLQSARDKEVAKTFEADIRKAGEYLLETYLGNIWPEMNIKWGEYQQQLGHQFEEEGYGCFRCHNEEHENSKGDTISQDCSLCHDEP